MENTRKPFPKTWYALIATFFGIGNYSSMPGTLGTLAAAALYLLAGGVHAVAIAAVTVVGVFAAERYAKETGKEDPGEIVIDEVVGYWISMWGIPMGYAAAGFFLFRIVDIIKPFPVRQMEKLPGGIGIMADDVCGGVMVNLLIRACIWLFISGGVAVVYEFLGLGG